MTTSRDIIAAEQTFGLDFDGDGIIGAEIVARADAADAAFIEADKREAGANNGDVALVAITTGGFAIVPLEGDTSAGTNLSTVLMPGVADPLVLTDRSGNWEPTGGTAFAVRALDDGGYAVLVEYGPGDWREHYFDDTGYIAPSVSNVTKLSFESLIQLERAYNQDFDGNSYVTDIAELRLDRTLRDDSDALALYGSDGDAVFVSGERGLTDDEGSLCPTDPELVAPSSGPFLFDAHPEQQLLENGRAGTPWDSPFAGNETAVVGIRAGQGGDYIVLVKWAQDMWGADGDSTQYYEQRFSAEGSSVGRLTPIDVTASEGLYLQDVNRDGLLDLTAMSFASDYVTAVTALSLRGETVRITMDEIITLDRISGAGTVQIVDNDGVPIDVSDDEGALQAFLDQLPQFSTCVNLSNTNAFPVAQNDSQTTQEDTPVTVTVLSNDSDPDSDTLTVTTATALNGSVTINGNGTLLYTPNENYSGSDTISYAISDNNGGTDTATVSVTITAENDPPVAQDDDLDLVEDTTLTGNVLNDNGNGVDTDPENQTLTVVAAGLASDDGRFDILSDGSFTFTPTTGFVGTTSFEYTLQDTDAATDTGTVTFTVSEGTTGSTSTLPSGFAVSETEYNVSGEDAVSITRGSDATATVTLTVDVPALPAKADVLLLQELSSSFKNDLTTLQGSTFVADLATTLGEAGITDLGFGIVSFLDYPFDAAEDPDTPDGFFGSFTDNDYPYKLEQTISTDTVVTQQALDDLTLLSGGDYPEAVLVALQQIALRADTEIGFRENAQRFVVIATDDIWHQEGDYAAGGDNDNDTDLTDGLGQGGFEDYPSVEDVTNLLVNAGITPIFTVAGKVTEYTQLVAQMNEVNAGLGGSVTSLSADSSDLAESIANGLNNATFSVGLTVTGDEFGFVTNVTPESHTGVTGPTQLSFDVTLSEPDSYADDTIRF